MDTDPVQPSMASIEDLYRQHYAELIQALRYMGATAAEADDAIGDVLLSMCRTWHAPKHPYAYARKAVRNAFLNLRHAAERQSAVCRQLQAQPSEHGEDTISIWEDREWVKQLLTALPPGQRNALACVIDGLAPWEIAELFGATPQAVRQNLHAARLRIKADLEARQARAIGTSTGKGE